MSQRATVILGVLTSLFVLCLSVSIFNLFCQSPCQTLGALCASLVQTCKQTLVIAALNSHTQNEIISEEKKKIKAKEMTKKKKDV